MNAASVSRPLGQGASATKLDVVGVSPDGEGRLKVSGTLTIKGQSRPLDLIATATEPAPGRAILTAEAEIDRRQWGITWAKMGAGVHNHLVVAAHFTRP